MYLKDEETLSEKMTIRKAMKSLKMTDIKIMTREREKERILILSFRQTQLFLKGWNFSDLLLILVSEWDI